MTYREKWNLEHPDWPYTPGNLGPGCVCGHFKSHPMAGSKGCLAINCRDCWNQEIVEISTTDLKSTDPTPILDEAIDPLHITFYPANIPNPDEMLAKVINTASAIKDRPVYITIM